MGQRPMPPIFGPVKPVFRHHRKRQSPGRMKSSAQIPSIALSGFPARCGVVTELLVSGRGDVQRITFPAGRSGKPEAPLFSGHGANP